MASGIWYYKSTGSCNKNTHTCTHMYTHVHTFAVYKMKWLTDYGIHSVAIVFTDLSAWVTAAKQFGCNHNICFRGCGQETEMGRGWVGPCWDWSYKKFFLWGPISHLLPQIQWEGKGEWQWIYMFGGISVPLLSMRVCENVIEVLFSSPV